MLFPRDTDNRREPRGTHLYLPDEIPESAPVSALAQTRFHSRRARIKAMRDRLRNDGGENSFAQKPIMLPCEKAEAEMSGSTPFQPVLPHATVGLLSMENP